MNEQPGTCERASGIIEPVFNDEDVRLFTDVVDRIVRGYYRNHGLPEANEERASVITLAQIQAWQHCLLLQAQAAARALRERQGQPTQ